MAAKEKKVFNPSAIFDRISLMALMMPDYELIDETRGGVVFSASLIKKDNPYHKINLWVQEHGYDGKVKASVTFPTQYGSYVPDNYRNSIMFSVEKDASKMKADILNKLLVGYEERLTEVVDSENSRKLYQEKEKALKDRLYKEGYTNREFGSSYEEYIGDKYRFNGPTKIEVQGQKIKLELGYLDAEKALKVLEYLQTLK
jgi:hypothetical protein